MADRYLPGEMSRQYQTLPPTERTEINRRADELFRQRTGIRRRLDPSRAADRPHVREWLRVRDEVMRRPAGSGPPVEARQRPALAYALDTLRSEAVNFGQRFIQDARVRAGYIEETLRFADDLLAEARAGRLTAEAAARQASEVRNEIMAAARLSSSDIGRAQAEALKATGRTLAELQEHYAAGLFRRSFNQLARHERDAVFLEVVRASGRPNLRISAGAARLARLGKGLIFVSLAFSVYNVATAEDHARAAAREGVAFGAGFAGSVAGGAVAGLACGPGAPVCVAVGAFVGGALFALGADITFDWLSN